MRGTGDDEQLLVLRIRIRFADGVVTFGLPFDHIFVGSFAEIARVSLLTMHHKDCRTNLVDIIKETGVGISLSADDAPTVVRIAAAGMISALGLVIIVVVLHELRSLVGQRIDDATGHRHRVGQALLGKCLTGSMARLFLVLAVEIAVATDAGHVVHRRYNSSLDACVGSGSIQCDATPTANADDANTFGIHIVLL